MYYGPMEGLFSQTISGAKYLETERLVSTYINTGLLHMCGLGD